MRIAIALMLIVGFTAVVGKRHVSRDLATARDLHGAAFSGSADCRRCHEDHFASWRRTFHRTMTQPATPSSVLGVFDGRELLYRGWKAQFVTREANGETRYVVVFTDPEGVQVTRPIDRTVGSHRYQQYLTREQDRWLRLPVAWHVEEQRFFHMNGAFLTPDPGNPASQADFHRHEVVWNDNCIFCHNVGPNPAYDGNSFSSEVAELGIACEACHGPSAEHAARNTNPLRRYVLHLSERHDPTTVNPRRLTAERSADICGRCHGQRLTDDVGRYLRAGDPFVPGDDLAHFSEPLWQDTSLNGEPDVFAARFWNDGTPRLTAYEYQGWLQSRCAQGELTCTSCHGMHEGAPEGQIRPSMEGDAMCAECHSLGDSHSRHSDVDCVDCHMPRIVYGVLDAHRTHRIEVPTPHSNARIDACSLCHVDRSREWMATARQQLWAPASTGETRSAIPDTGGLPYVYECLAGGDPIERALCADALGRSGPGRSDLGSREEHSRWLLDAMQHDPYPAVRRLAWRALRRLHDLPTNRFVPEAIASHREDVVAGLQQDLGIRPLNPTTTAALRREAELQSISIGE